MRKPSVSHLVYRALYPTCSIDDPDCFATHIGRYIVPELRVEVFNFYGNFEEIEAKYPGLDYSYPPHRLRLGRFPYHRQLFQVFDSLGLTKNELYWLCSWEGTKLARDRFEKDQNLKVIDTTGDGIKRADPPKPQTVEFHEPTDKEIPGGCVTMGEQSAYDVSSQFTGLESCVKDCSYIGTYCPGTYDPNGLEVQQEDDDEEGNGEYDETEEQIVQDPASQQAASASASSSDPFGYSLNQRLMAANAARVSRQQNLPLDAAYEQWLKEEVERNDSSSRSAHAPILAASTPSSVPSSYDDCLPASSDQLPASDHATAQGHTSTPFSTRSALMLSRSATRRAQEAQALLDRRREELLRLNGADRQASPFMTATQNVSSTPHRQSNLSASASSLANWTHPYGMSGHRDATSSNPSLHYSLSNQNQQQRQSQDTHQQLDRELHEQYRQRQRLMQLQLLGRQRHARSHNASSWYAQTDSIRPESRRRDRNRPPNQMAPS